MEYAIAPFRRPVVVRPVLGPPGVEGPVVGLAAEWLRWNAATQPVRITKPAVLLDAFCRLARPTDAALRLGLVRDFADAFGPWSYCESGDTHADFDAPGLGGVPQTREQAKVREARAAERRPMGPPRGKPGRPLQWIPGLLVSAARVNALRGVVASVMQGHRADPRLWRVVWPAAYRRPFGLGSLEDEAGGAYFLVGRWLAAEHVELRPPLGGREGTARVGGVAGALAVALANEFDPRNRVARCTHRLRGGHCGDIPTRLPGAERCGVTWQPGRRTNGGGLPPRCPACDSLHRVTELRVNRRKARAKAGATSR